MKRKSGFADEAGLLDVLLLDMHVLLGEWDFDAVLVQRVVDGA